VLPQPLRQELQRWQGSDEVCPLGAAQHAQDLVQDAAPGVLAAIAGSQRLAGGVEPHHPAVGGVGSAPQGAASHQRPHGGTHVARPHAELASDVVDAEPGTPGEQPHDLELTDGLIDALVERGRSLGSELTQVELLAMGGAMRRVASDATAFPYRDAAWLLNVPAS
jgi:hypothetical protein